eukprot:1374117-Lingulodinium_polyedra.AAC.1
MLLSRVWRGVNSQEKWGKVANHRRHQRRPSPPPSPSPAPAPAPGTRREPRSKSSPESAVAWGA